MSFVCGPARLFAGALFVSNITGCTAAKYTNPASESTLNLCRVLAKHPDQDYRLDVAKILVRRGATAEKCQRLIAADNSMAVGIAVAGVAVGAAAAGGGGYYPNSAYGVAWDQFYDANYQLIWRCRDRSTGRFVYDYSCAGMPMNDFTWPGWSA